MSRGGAGYIGLDNDRLGSSRLPQLGSENENFLYLFG